MANFSENGLKLTIPATYLALNEKHSFSHYISLNYDKTIRRLERVFSSTRARNLHMP